MQKYFPKKQYDELKRDSVQFTKGWTGKNTDILDDLNDNDNHDFQRYAYKSDIDNTNTNDNFNVADPLLDYSTDEYDDNSNLNNQKQEQKQNQPQQQNHSTNVNTSSSSLLLSSNKQPQAKIVFDFTNVKPDDKGNKKKNAYYNKNVKKKRDEKIKKEKIEKHESEKPDIDAQISLSQSQYRVLKAILQKKSVFYTGSAGTGKSYILKVLQDVISECGATSTFHLTAPTGVAACNIGGSTVHNWAGIGQTLDPNDDNFILQMGRQVESKNRWKDAKLLVIDEISMLSAEIFDALNQAGQRIRSNYEPFGGIQIVVCGDFFQLPPVGVNNRDLSKKCNYCFHSEVWNQLFNHQDGMIVLDKVFRQKEQAFLDMLNELRRGYVSEDTNRILLNKVKQTAEDERKSQMKKNESNSVNESEIVPTKLFPTNKDVDSINQTELNRLPGECEPVYERHIEGTDKYKKQLEAGMKAPRELFLKIGAQVMLLRNLSVLEGLVNGTRGVVVGFSEELGETYGSALFPKRSLPIVEFDIRVGNRTEKLTKPIKEEEWKLEIGGKTWASFLQIPLMLAWAISIHKSQGMTITDLEVSFNGMFEFGQAYVSLSRATDFNRLRLKGYSGPYQIKCSKEVKDFYTKLGYNKESLHKDDATVYTSIRELCEIYCNHARPSPPKPANDGWLDADPKASKLRKTDNNMNVGISKHQEALLRKNDSIPISNEQRKLIENRTIVTLSDDDDDDDNEIENMNITTTETYVTPFSKNVSNNISKNDDNITPANINCIPNSFPSQVQVSSGSKLTDEQRKKIEQNRAAALEKKRKREQEMASKNSF